jgi:DNA polymerase III epsilon subunit-like protein
VSGVEIPVRDPAPPDPEALRVNGIDPEAHLARALHPVDAVNILEVFCLPHFSNGRVTLAGHNVAFDAAFLRRLYLLAEIDYTSRYFHRTVDLHSVYAVLMAAGTAPPLETLSLQAIARALGVEPEQPAHSALADALTTARCLAAVVERLARKRHAIRAVQDWAELAASAGTETPEKLLWAGRAEGGADVLQVLFGPSDTLDRTREAVRSAVKSLTPHDAENGQNLARKARLGLSLLLSGWSLHDAADALGLDTGILAREIRHAAADCGVRLPNLPEP